MPKHYGLNHLCELCGKSRGDHKAVDLNCPVGMRHRANTRAFHPTQTYVPSDKKPRPPKFYI